MPTNCTTSKKSKISHKQFTKTGSGRNGKSKMVKRMNKYSNTPVKKNPGADYFIGEFYQTLKKLTPISLKLF